MLKSLNYKARVLVFSCSVMFGLSISAQKRDNHVHKRFLDSAENHIDTDSKKALLFLDSIPAPIGNYIPGRLAEYYALKALIHDDFKQYSKMNQCNILALKYAEEEENYEVAGQASLDLFADIYFIGRDTMAYQYLDRATAYYKKCNYENGLLEIEQMRAYAKFLDGDTEACNQLLLDHLESYKSVKDDAYFYLFATYMLTSNYINEDNLDEAHIMFREFNSLAKDTTIAEYNYCSFKAAINTSFAEVHLKKHHLDSVFYYLDESSRLFKYMGEDVIRDYYKLYAEAHKTQSRIDISKKYLDSLIAFEDKIYKSNLDASYEINDSLLKVENDLQKVNNSRFFNVVIILILLVFLVTLSVLYWLFYRRNKSKVSDLSNQTEHFSYLKSNNEKLTAKVQGLEDYINQLKKEVKSIATLNDVSHQREKIKCFYKNLHHHSTTLLDKTESHFELVNDLNVDFFKKIQELYPQLNDSEVIICYYLFIGFKNKEISVFLNTTVRAVESKRYRITKKIDLNNMTLLQYLKETFK